MQIALLVLAGWTGALLLVLGLFLALVRGSGGSDLAPLPGAHLRAAPELVLPAQRAPEADPAHSRT